MSYWGGLLVTQRTKTTVQQETGGPVRTRNRILATMAVLAVGVAASAQAQSHPQTRQGFWIGFGLGAGQATPDCGTCSNLDAGTGGSGYLRLGGRLNNSWLLGGESNSWVGTIDDNTGGPSTDVVAGFIAAAAYFYPNPASGLFIKGGLGFYNFSGDDGTDDYASSAPMILLGLGYDIRVGRMISITPVLTILQSGEGDLEVNSVASGVTDFKSRVIGLQVGVTFH